MTLFSRSKRTVMHKERWKSHVNCCRISVMMFTPVRLCNCMFSLGHSGPPWNAFRKVPTASGT